MSSFKLFRSTVWAALFIAGANPSFAGLIDRGGGMIYDSDLNITWLANANLSAGSTYDNGSSTTDGMMTWDNAKAWSANLVYGGYDDWRLPSTLQPDTSCTGFPNVYPGGTGSNCTGSELGHLFYIEFGATFGSSILSGSNATNLALFSNVQNNVYWSGTIWSPTIGGADPGPFVFETANGRQVIQAKDLNYYAWAVRSGDVANTSPPITAVPEPESYAMLLAGLGLLGFARRRKQQAA